MSISKRQLTTPEPVETPLLAMLCNVYRLLPVLPWPSKWPEAFRSGLQITGEDHAKHVDRTNRQSYVPGGTRWAPRTMSSAGTTAACDPLHCWINTLLFESSCYL